MATNKPDDPVDLDDEPGPSSFKIPKLKHQNKDDHKKQIHYNLIAELTDFIFVGWPGYEKLLIRLKGKGLTPIDKVYCRESASNLFDWMQRKGIIKVGQYDVLLEVLEEENESAIEIIRQYQEEIEKISRKEEDSKQEDEPGPSCSKIRKYWLKNKATLSGIAERTLNRMDTQWSSKTFVETQAVRKGKHLLEENKILIYTGLPGEGKTENALYLLNLMKKENPNGIYIKLDSLSEWDYVNPSLNLVILLDDPFGKTNANLPAINDNEKWKGIESCIKKGKVRLILTIRKHIFVNNCTKLENNGTELFMKKNVIDLSSKDFCLTKENKKDILLKHCRSRNIEICEGWKENLTLADRAENNLKISQHTLDGIVKTDCPIGFPYTCYLFFSHSKYTKQGVKFFKKPLEDLKININELASSNSEYLEKTQYCLMCYMMLKGGDINLKELDQDMLDNIITSVGIKMPSEREKKEAIEKLNHRYVVGEYPKFSLKHQTILECVAICFADDNFELLLQLCSTKFISEFMRPTDYKKKDGEEIIRLDQNDYKHVIKRVIKNLQENYGYRSEWWSNHPLLGDKQFVDLLIDEIKSNELCNNVRRLCDESLLQRNLFIDACYFGYTYFIDKLYNELHVDLSDVDTGSALIQASRGGHTGTVMWFLNSNIKTGSVAGAIGVAPTDTLTSIISHQSVTLTDVKLALTDDNYCMSIGKHCDNRTVDLLLNRWPDMDLKFVLKLFNACIDCDNEKTTSLITRKSDEIQHCINEVCYKGSFKVLKSIINEMPHIKTKKILNTSFTSACAGGHLEIVEYLLGLNDNEIDKKSIYLSDNDMNITNLHVAAYFGNFEILMKLVAIGVDVNCKSKTKKSALSYAIEGYETESELVTTNNEIINLLCCCLKRKNFSLVYDMKRNTNSDYIKVFDYLLILDGINLNDLDIVLDEHGSTFAHYCTLNNETKTIDLLINKYKTVIFSKTNEGLTSLHIAAFMGYFDVFEVLVKAGLSINDKDKSHRSVLQYAIMGYIFNCSGHGENMKSYLSNFHLMKNFKRKLFENRYFSKGDRLQILTYILQSSDVSLEELDILDDFGMSLVHYCTSFDDEKAIELLHSCYKQSVFSRTKKGLTCLHIAAFYDNGKAFKALVKAGLGIKDRDMSDRSVLQYAVMSYIYYFNFASTKIKNYSHHIDGENDIESSSLPFELNEIHCFVSAICFEKLKPPSILLDILRSNDVSFEELDILDNRGLALVHYCVLLHDVNIINLLIEKVTKSISCKTKDGLTCFHIAALFGYFDIFKVLVEAGLNIKDKDKSDRSVLQYAFMGYKYYYTNDEGAIGSNSLPFDLEEISLNIKLFLVKGQESDGSLILNHILQSSDVSLEELGMLDNRGMALVHYCVLFNNVVTIKLLASNYQKYIYYRTKKGLTCLHIAAFTGNSDVFEVLVNVGLSIKDRDNSATSVLQYAIMGSICERFHDSGLIDSDSLLVYIDSISQSMNHSLAKDNYLRILTYILQSNDVSLEELDILDNNGMALVHYCVLLNDVHIIKLLIEKFTKSISCKTKDGLTCLHIAALFGYFDIFKVLVEAGLNIKDKDKSDKSVLQYAIMGYKYSYTDDEKILEKIPHNIKDFRFAVQIANGLPILNHILQSSDVSSFLVKGQESDGSLILNHILQSSDVSLEELGMLDNRGMALVHYCVLFNNVVTIKLLVNRYKKCVYERTEKGLTCLQIAAFTGNSDVFEVLVEAGLNIKDKDKSDRSVLQYVIMGYKYRKFRISTLTNTLLIDLESILESTNYFFINEEMNLQILTYILQSSDASLEELDFLDDFGMALVHYCTMYGDVQSIQILIERCSKSVFCRTKEGLTCLHIAAFLGNLNLFEVLVKAGLNTKELDNSSRSVLQYTTKGSCFYKKSGFEQSKAKSENETFIVLYSIQSKPKSENDTYNSLYSLEENSVPSWRRVYQRRDFEKIIKACTH